MFNAKSFSLFVLILLFLSQSSFTQTVLQGTVTDNGTEYLGNGAEPVAGALVTLTDQADTNRTFSTYTDELGYYSIEITQTFVDDNPSVKPCIFRLLQNYPNPFNPSTVIGYELSQSTHISIEIYNVLGQKVKTLFDGLRSTSGQVIWNGTNNMGLGVPAGLYIYSMKAGEKRVNRKMLLIDGHQGRINTPASPSFCPKHSSNSELQKQLSNQYMLTVTGDNIASYEQQDLEILASIIIDITVNRTVTDIDGNLYRTVKIGNQWWMAENLKVTHYRNGDAIPNVTDNTEWVCLITGAYCVYENDKSHSDVYGYLYNWYAVGDSRNIAPQGWHVPTDEEWKELEMHLGMSQSEANAYGWRNTDKGGKLKETGMNHWISPNTGATNESGFTSIPGGYRISYGTFDLLGCSAFFWLSSEYGNHKAWLRTLYHYYSDVSRFHDFKQVGYSVRLIKD